MALRLWLPSSKINLSISLLLFVFWWTPTSCFNRGLIAPTENSSEDALQKWNVVENKVKKAVDDVVSRLFPIVSGSDNEVDLSMECSEALLRWVIGLKDMKTWAIRMLDSTGKPNGGILTGSVAMLGHYHECLNVQFPLDEGDEERIVGKYCFVNLRMPLPPRRNLMGFNEDAFSGINFTFETEIMETMRKYAQAMYSGPFTLGICIPSSCHTEDMNKLLETVTLPGGTPSNLDISSCQTQQSLEPSFPQNICLIVFGIILLINFLGFVADTIWTDELNQQKSLLGSLSAAFSPLRNFRKIMVIKPRTPEDIFSCLNGARFISLLWVILNHTYLSIHPIVLNHVYQLEDEKKLYYNQLMLNGYLNVDTFFTITGILLSYNIVKHCDQKGGFRISMVPVMILKRIWRFIPSAMLTVALMVVFPLWLRGPLRVSIAEIVANNCVERWWTVPLFITNFYELETTCLPHYWYISVDIQMFLLISCLYFVLLYKNSIFGHLYLSFMILTSILVPAMIIYVNNWPPIITLNYADVSFVRDFTVMIYEACYNHFGTYSIGLMLGTFMARNQNKVKVNKYWLSLGWLLSTVTALTVIYGVKGWNEGREPTTLESIFYGGLHKNAWALSITWVFFVCSIGKGGVVNDFLSWTGFQPLVKISFVMYLIQQIVVFSYGFSREVTEYLSHITYAWVFFANAALSCLFAMVLRVLFDGPMTELDRLFFGWLGNKSSGKPKKETISNSSNGAEVYKKHIDNELQTKNGESSKDEL